MSNLSELLGSGDVDLASGVTGTLPVANGGTGSTSLTANNVILGNGTSAVQAVAPSTSGNVLTSNGTTWQSVAPEGGAERVLLSESVFSNTSFVSLSFSNGTYDRYELDILGVVPYTNNTQLSLQFSTNGGASWGASNYSIGLVSLRSTTVQTYYQYSYSQSPFTYQVYNNAYYHGVQGRLSIYNTQSTINGDTVPWNFTGGHPYNGTTQMSPVMSFGKWQRNAAADVDAMKLFFQSGNLRSGKVRLYGVID